MGCRHQPRQSRPLSNDRLSNLPTGVLHHILSLVPIDTTVRTTILSSQWRHLWCTNPSLHFPDFTELDAEIELEDYVDGSDSCLDLCESTEHFTSLSFTISYLFEVDQRLLMASRWVEFASTHIVDFLSLTYEYPSDEEVYNDDDELAWFLPFPDTVFCCWSIRTLKLDHCALPDILAEFDRPIFPFLETAFLKSVAFVADTLSGLISASPKLWTLNIAGLRFTDKIVISSPTLETIDLYWNVLHIHCPVDIRSAPRLQFLGVCCDITSFKTVSLVNIEEITLLNHARKKFCDRTEWRCLVSAVRNARVLGVGERFTQFMLNGDRDFNNRLPLFGNFKRLDFCGRPIGFSWVF